MAAWYRRHGFEIVERNWRSGRLGEIDLVARRGDLVVVCEVKTRTSSRHGSPAQAVTVSKQRRLRRLAAAWLSHRGVNRVRIRFDVAAVCGPSIDVFENAF